MQSTPRKHYTDSEILVVGLARNCGKTIGAEVSRLAKATAGFKETYFLIIESDSDDDTLDVLKKATCTIDNFSYRTLGTLSEDYPKRTERIAVCRNEYITALRTEASYAKVNYVAVADMDGANSSLNERSVQSCWSCTEDWDVVAANQAGPYYDIWALRHSDWQPGDCWQSYSALKKVFGEKQAIELAVRSKQISIDKNAKPIEVESAFGGFAIYKREAMLAGTYVGIGADGDEICEHVTFHQGLRSCGYRIFINPAMINSHTPNHTPQIGLFQRLALKFDYLFRYLR